MPERHDAAGVSTPFTRCREPSGAAKQLLKIAERHPEVLIEVAA